MINHNDSDEKALSKKTVILCCYEHYDEEKRSQAEIKGYEKYLKAAQNFLADCNDEFEALKQYRALALIVAGGFTRSDSSISEAASVVSFCLQAKNLYANRWIARKIQLDHKLYLEERSTTTAENIILSIQDFVLEKNLSKDVIIICDRPRHLPCLVIAGYAKRMFRVEGMKICVVSFPLPDIHPNSQRRIQFLKAGKMWLMPQTITPTFWKEKGGWKRYLFGLQSL